MRSAAASHRTGFVDPLRITLALWLFVIAGAALADLNPLSPMFLLFVAVGIGAHVAGMGLRRTAGDGPHATGADAPELSRSRARSHWRRANRTTAGMCLLLLLGLLYFIAAYADVVPSLDTAGFLAARNAYLEEVLGLRDKQFLYTTHLTLLGLSTMYFSARAYGEARVAGLAPSRLVLNLATILTFAIALLTTGRTAPLLVILSYSFYGLRFGVYSKSTIIAAFAVLSLTMFFLVAFALGKEGRARRTKSTPAKRL